MATRRYGEPRFKRNCQSESFRFDNGIEKRKHHAVRIHGKYIHVPRLGWVKMREEVRFTGTVRSATISRQADRWYASLAIETPHRVPGRNDHSVAGCDLGLSTFAVIADESGCRKYFAPKPLTNMMIRLRRLHRACTRKVPGSSNWSKAKTKLRRTYARISDIRLDALHKITIDLVRKHRTIGIEDLNPTGIMSNRHVSRSAFDVAFGEFRRQLTYKSVMNGTTLVVIDRWYASSKTCSACGWVNADLAFGQKEWTCLGCLAKHDRDENAAINLRIAASSAVTACGAEGSGPAWECRVKPAALKQEGLQIADRNGQEVVVLYQSQTP